MMDPSNSQLLQVIATNSQQQCSSKRLQPSSDPHPQNNKKAIAKSVLSQPAAAHLKCPRCDSNNTKFCYYNNYSLSQPRYFCKGCRRYWTQGGSLRNVPVGGGCRKAHKRPSPPTSTTTSTNSILSSASCSSNKKSLHQDNHQRFTTNPNPLLIPNGRLLPLLPLTYDPYSSHDLTLPFSIFHKPPTTDMQLGFDDDQLAAVETSNANSMRNPCVITNTRCHPTLGNNLTTSTITSNNHPIISSTTSNVVVGGGGGGGFLDALRNGFVETQSGLYSFQNGGFDSCNVGDLDDDQGCGGGGLHYHRQEITDTTTMATTITTSRTGEEACKERDVDNEPEGNKVFVNFPWQIGGGEDMLLGGVYNVDSAGKENWINGIGSSWHGLVNSTTSL